MLERADVGQAAKSEVRNFRPEKIDRERPFQECTEDGIVRGRSAAASRATTDQETRGSNGQAGGVT
jgi:hypothetical protein